MIDFLMISTRFDKRGTLEIYPKFIVKKSSDLMIRGGDFYAIWIEELGLWSTDENDALQLIDRELDRFAKENAEKFDARVKVLYLWDSENRMIERWHTYCKKDMRDNFHMLDEKLIFSNTETKKKDYASKKLPYPLEYGKIDAYDHLMSTLYSPEERRKIEWAIGSIVSGDSKKIQKFLVLYGAAGTGKSTVLNIVQQLFDGYYSVFDAKALGSASNSFALEAFKTNPLVAIQHDGDLSRIEDNTRLNSLVSHELMTVNEKFKATYANRFKCFLFMGTNKPVRITDAKSGLIRRLIDVQPSGNKLTAKDYKSTVKKIEFELGSIASHCKEVYLEDPGMFDDYIPTGMMGASNDFYNFISDSYALFVKNDDTTLNAAWEMYKNYCADAKVAYPYSKRNFKEELKNYFQDYYERYRDEAGTRYRNYYVGFTIDKFNQEEEVQETKHCQIEFKEQPSLFDDICADCFAQYANDEEKPMKKWENVKTKLKSLNTSRIHYVRLPANHIVIDFDIPDADGNKSFERNLEEASKWPPTYAELSKSGAGIHLHYIYTGDPEKLSRVYGDHIEIKVFTGNSSLRRKLSKCNDIPIATINSGLPLKGEKMINMERIQGEKSLRVLIKRNLNKEIHPGTKPSIDFIYKILEDAYASDLKYDVSDMRGAILAFAANSTHQSEYCIKLVGQMKFQSEEPSDNKEYGEKGFLVFYDIEIFPNLALVNWKREGKENPVVRMINPTPAQIEELMRFKLVGFNCRRYDNHLIYAMYNGYTNEQLYRLSQKIISGDKNAFFGEAYNLSYTDVYDFASAGNKKSLKKLEIEMGIHHQELGLPWDQPVPEELWPKVAEYCDNDVIATEAAFNYLKDDWTAREILAEMAGMTVNDTTNQLTTRFIFGSNKHPQNEFNYRDMALPVDRYIFGQNYHYRVFDNEGRPQYATANGDLPLPEGWSYLPFFPGYTFEGGKSIYRGDEAGEGGYVYSEPGMYGNVALLDIASMHPHSVIAEQLFGEEYTARFKEIVDARIAIKHKDFDKAKQMLNGALAKFLDEGADSKALANALKTAINSVYGLTSAKFDNAFRDPRNKDNIVAKRGALFMINLKNEVQRQGFKVAHIKTDSIKIPDATPEIIKFVMDYGREYGYNFEHEATYDRMCLVNKAVYIAKYASPDKCQELYGYVPEDNAKKWQKDRGWTATGDEFAVPYIFKSLFSKEPIVFEDLCETFAVSKGDLYLDMNEQLEDVSAEEKELIKLKKAIEKDGNQNDPRAERVNELQQIVDQGHDYHFVGRVGQFTPIKAGKGGGVLYRVNEGKHYAAADSTGYRWLESETLRRLDTDDQNDLIDRGFYETMLHDAIGDIVAHGDYEWFISDDPYTSPEFFKGHPVYPDTLPFN